MRNKILHLTRILMDLILENNRINVIIRDSVGLLGLDPGLEEF